MDGHEGGSTVKLRVVTISALAALMLPASPALGNGGPIMPLSQVQPGMDCTGETVVQGTTISSFNVHVINVVQDPVKGPRILVRVSGPAVDPTGVAEGFSGSPVYCPSGMVMANAGAISETIGEWGNDVALVTPIELMLGEPVSPPPSAPLLLARTKPLLGPLTVDGLSPALTAVVQRAAQRAGRLVVSAPAAPPAAFPVQPLVPGASVAVSYSTGAIPFSGVGTVTYRDGQTVYAFGHELDGAGRRSLLLQDAYVYYVVNNPLDSYKLAAPGNTVGTLTSDTPNAVIGQVGALPALVPVDVSATDQDTGLSLTLHSQVADETDIGLPLGSSLVDMIAPIEVAQAATDIYDGPPANESGQMCIHIYLRETRAPLGFCNRYVGTGVPGDAGGLPPQLALASSTDVGTAFGLLEQVEFAKLHVTRVAAQLHARRGLAEATIVGAKAAVHVRPGQRVRVRLLVRVFRGALRTINFTIRIPRHKHGLLRAVIHGTGSQGPGGPSAGGDGGLVTILSIALGGPPSGPPSQPPSSIAQLRNAIAGIAPYDGLLFSSHGRPAQRVYRDPALLINGRAALTFQVR